MAAAKLLWHLHKMTAFQRHRLYGLFLAAALLSWAAIGWPALQLYYFGSGITSTGYTLTASWVAWFAIYGLALVALALTRASGAVGLALAATQAVATTAMAWLDPSPVFAVLLVPIAWQIALMLTPRLALLCVAGQTIALLGAVRAAQPTFEYCYIFGLSIALQLFFVFTGHALRRERETSKALAARNLELRAAQAMLDTNIRAAERTRISRELHDLWGHELTALGLHLEIASHKVSDRAAQEQVVQARAMASGLLAKVRDVVSTLREAERADLYEALHHFAANVPSPAVHVDMDRDLSLTPEQAHALIRCAQEAITNSMRHAGASNLWLRVAAEGGGIRFIAHDDGRAGNVPAPPGTGLKGMRERLEALGGSIDFDGSAGAGFTINAWLPRSGSSGLAPA